MKRQFTIAISMTAAFLSSCATTGGGWSFETYSFEEAGEEALIDVPVRIPEVNLFVSAGYGSESSGGDLKDFNDVVIPLAEVPVVPEEPLPEPERIIAEIETESLPAAAAADPVKADKAEESPGTIRADLVAEAVAAESVPVSQPSLPGRRAPEEPGSVSAEQTPPPAVHEIHIVPDEEIVLSLEGEGWIFDSGRSTGAVELAGREFAGGDTNFMFRPGQSAEIVLVFRLQNSESGREESMSYRLIPRKDEEGKDLSPVVIDPEASEMASEMNSADDGNLQDSVREENVPGLVASFGQLVSDDADPGSELMADAFSLLERQGGYDNYLVQLAESSFRLYPYDNRSAELLFRAAEAVERPGSDQDIEKAVALFRMVRDYFPLSVYSDRAEERIRYLERHFMKIY